LRKISIAGWLLVILAIAVVLYGLSGLKTCPADVVLGVACEQSNSNLGLLVIGGAIAFLVGCVMIILGFIKPLLNK
jgi:uncharacterized membrane protein YczE